MVDFNSWCLDWIACAQFRRIGMVGHRPGKPRPGAAPMRRAWGKDYQKRTLSTTDRRPVADPDVLTMLTLTRTGGPYSA